LVPVGAGGLEKRVEAQPDWRDVGPMRGGRTYGVAGHADQPDTFYMGSVGGGVWKTENSGRTWFPISDEGIPIGSIGAIAVAPSNANVVYVGTGEPDIRSQHSYGIGMFKSTDAGKTWTTSASKHAPDRPRRRRSEGRQSRLRRGARPCLRAQPRSRSLSLHRRRRPGRKILFEARDPNDVGAVDLAIDPKNPRVLYASLWARGVRHGRFTRRPICPAAASSNPPTAATPGSSLTGGLPTDDFVGKIGIAIAQQSQPSLGGGGRSRQRIAAAPARRPRRAPALPDPEPTGGQAHGGGVYLSDDAGATWKLVNAEQPPVGPRLVLQRSRGRSHQSRPRLRHQHRDLHDHRRGKTFVPVKGAPGGDDYHQLWINPKDGNRMVLSSDQGTVVSVDGAKTWSTWYNQPTAQIYHVAADNRFPYWLYGAQQDSGGVGVSTWSRRACSPSATGSRLPGGRKQHRVPDPKDGNILYGSGAGRCDQA
jgi:hypothetical protein